MQKTPVSPEVSWEKQWPPSLIVFLLPIFPPAWNVEADLLPVKFHSGLELGKVEFLLKHKAKLTFYCISFGISKPISFFSLSSKAALTSQIYCFILCPKTLFTLWFARVCGNTINPSQGISFKHEKLVSTTTLAHNSSWKKRRWVMCLQLENISLPGRLMVAEKGEEKYHDAFAGSFLSSSSRPLTPKTNFHKQTSPIKHITWVNHPHWAHLMLHVLKERSYFGS